MPKISKQATLSKDFEAIAKSGGSHSLFNSKDWLDENNLELDDEDGLDHPSDAGKRCSQIFAYMLEVR